MNRNGKVITLIQCRMGSTRLPNKAMLSLHGHPIIDWVYTRASKAKEVEKTIVAVPEGVADDVLAFYLNERKAEVFRGNELDVLDRFYHAALKYEPWAVVRICADNPLVSPEEIDHLVRFFRKNELDYAYNHIPKSNTYPDGLGAEIVTFAALTKAQFEAKDARYREHCFSYIAENPALFKSGTFNPPNAAIARPDLKLDVDTLDDFYHLLRHPMQIDFSSEQVVRTFNKS